MSGDGTPPRPDEFMSDAGAGDGMNGEVPPAAGGGGGGWSKRVMNGLLSTEPADEPAFDRPREVEHVRIGVKKFLNGLLDSAEIGRGRTALEDFALAGIHALGPDDGDGDDETAAVDGLDNTDVDDRLDDAGPRPDVAEGP